MQFGVSNLFFICLLSLVRICSQTHSWHIEALGENFDMLVLELLESFEFWLMQL